MPVACQLPLAFAFRGLHGTAVPTHCPLLLTFVKAMARLSRVLKRPLGGLPLTKDKHAVETVVLIPTLCFFKAYCLLVISTVHVIKGPSFALPFFPSVFNCKEKLYATLI